MDYSQQSAEKGLLPPCLNEKQGVVFLITASIHLDIW
jgi:hypothetical protein